MIFSLGSKGSRIQGFEEHPIKPNSSFLRKDYEVMVAVAMKIVRPDPESFRSSAPFGSLFESSTRRSANRHLIGSRFKSLGSTVGFADLLERLPFGSRAERPDLQKVF
jgi:hypothetical protein